MNNHTTDIHTRTGTIGGLVSVFLFTGQQLLVTAVTAATGAIVSFAVSMLCKFLVRKLAKRKEIRMKGKRIKQGEKCKES